MIQHEIAKLFSEAADILEIRDENRFRIRAYRRAAQSLESFGGDLAGLAQEGALSEIDGVGNDLAAKIEEYLANGEIQAIEKLRASVDPGLIAMLEISGMGPRSVGKLHAELGIRTIEELELAVRSEKVRAVAGFGPKKEEKILEGIKLHRRSLQRLSLSGARRLAQALTEFLNKKAQIKNVEIAGSLRRGKESIGDIDLLLTSGDLELIAEKIQRSEHFSEFVARGNTKVSFRTTEGIQVDIRQVKPGSFGAALLYFTGSKEHNVKLRERAIHKGFRLNEYGIFNASGDTLIAAKTERAVYQKLGLSWIPPELREARGEIETAEKGQLPDLVSEKTIKGDFHTHTNWSDGKHELKQMLDHANRLGYSYYAVTDHSQSLKVANGLSPERLSRQIKEIRKLDNSYSKMRVLAGAEVDILKDGNLDFSEEDLNQLDFVVASVHTNFNLSEEQMTKRVIRAMENPFVNVLGHPTGRLVGKRSGFEVNISEIAEAAARTQTALEINGSEKRMDLNDAHIREAAKSGCLFVLTTDAHQKDQLDAMPNAISMARRAGLSADRIINTWPRKNLIDWIRNKRKSAK